MDGFLRRATPIVLLALAALAWFENWLPGHETMAARFGEDGVLRFVLGLLCIYMVMLVLERQRLEFQFKQLLGAFKEFHEQVRPDGSAGQAEAKKREAIELLVAALSSADVGIRDNAVSHLQRLTGQNLGKDPETWRTWWAQQSDPGGA